MICSFLRHAAAKWYLYAPLLAIWIVAAYRVFVDHVPRLPILVSLTPSVPYTVAMKMPDTGAYKRGDYVVFAFRGQGTRYFPGLADQPFFKRIAGMPGDRITVRGRHVFVNDTDMGLAKTHAMNRIPLEPITDTVIPPAHFYVQGTSADSFDSRYKLVGLVSQQHILFGVKPLL